MDKPIRVCMVLEGSYPFITGGVAAWVQDIIQGLPEIEFSLLTFSPQANQKLRYTLPPNVKEHVDLVLSDAPRKNAGKRPKKRSIAAVLQFHQHMFENKVVDFNALIGAPKRLEEFDNGLLRDKNLWNLLVQSNLRKNPAYPFSDYFWAWQSSHRLLFNTLQAKAPEADIYHAISTGFAGLASLVASRKRNKPFLLTEHGLYHKEREIEIRKADFVRGYQRDMWINIYNNLSKICYQSADVVTALFEENRQKQIELGADPTKCLVIPNGIDIERFSSVERKKKPGFHVGLVGRIVSIKDVKTYIAVAKIVLEQIPEATFYAIGPTDEEPEYYRECVAMVESFHIQDRFIFTGRQNVLEYYAFLDLMLLTSVREAQPLVILEGWVAGVPCISTKVGNAPEMLDYDERFLAPSKDPEKLAKNVMYVYQHPELMKEINERNKQKAIRLYNKKDLIQRYRDLYAQLGPEKWKSRAGEVT
ncbi:MAG: GT4 family glycosyltransferase PelF [Treponema sp.]|nr:GT4 family glycosyltransferase PelF [Treponema sp.]